MRLLGWAVEREMVKECIWRGKVSLHPVNIARVRAQRQATTGMRISSHFDNLIKTNFS